MNNRTVIFSAVVLLTACSAVNAGSFPDGRTVTIAPGVQLKRIYHNQHLLPDREHAGFGSLLYDESGKVVTHDGNKTWLYTTSLFEPPAGAQRDWYGKWISDVREFDLKTFASGEKKLTLGLEDGDKWAVIHDVIRVSSDLFVAFYSSSGGVRAAIAGRPDGPFSTVADFRVAVTDPWERAPGHAESLESNGAHVLIEDSSGTVTLWLGYDSYHVDQTSGQLGWAKVQIDKALRTVRFIEKFSGNPLPLLPKDYIAARCGGNLAGDIGLENEYAFFYYTRPNRQKMALTVALSPDPLFQRKPHLVELEHPTGDEKVMEKFETYMLDGELHIIYENNLVSGHWGTGMLIYQMKRKTTNGPTRARGMWAP